MKIPPQSVLRTVARRHGLRLIVLFGSQVRRRTHPESDVDVAVLTGGSLLFAQRLDLWRELSEAFGAEVDLSVLNHVEPLLLYQVASKGMLLYQARPGEWPEFRGYAYRYYWDTQKLRDDLSRYIQRQIRGWHHVR